MLQRGVGVVQWDTKTRVVAGAGAKRWQIELLWCASVKSLWVCIHGSPVRWDVGETFQVERSKSFGVSTIDPRCGQESAQGSFHMKAFGGQDILKPTWAQSIFEILLLVFKSLSCGEKCLPSAKTQRALEEKRSMCEPEKDLQVFIL